MQRGDRTAREPHPDPYAKHINMYPQSNIQHTKNANTQNSNSAPYPIDDMGQSSLPPPVTSSSNVRPPMLMKNTDASMSSLSFHLQNLSVNEQKKESPKSLDPYDVPFQFKDEIQSNPSPQKPQLNAKRIQQEEKIGTSQDAVEYRRLYELIIKDTPTFTPTLQMQWCETLLLYSFKEDFIANYNINAEKLPRTLNSSESIKNQKIFLEHSFKVLTKLIQLKYPQAIYLMGTLYSHQPYLQGIKNKNIVSKNDLKALQYYMKAANLNHSDSCYRTAISFEYQKGTPPTCAKEKCLQMSLQYYELGAQLNSQACMYKLGMAYLYGLEKEPTLYPARDIRLSVSYFQKCNTAQSNYELGKFYEQTTLPIPIQNDLQSQGIIRDSNLALRYYHESATKFNYPLAQWKLGHCYELGELSLPIDAQKSIAWYHKAATPRDSSQKGNPMAMLAISGWYLTGAPGVLKPNYNESFQWLYRSEKISEGKLPRVEFILGSYYANGIGCDRNLNLAKIHFQIAANLGFLRAIEALKRFN